MIRILHWGEKGGGELATVKIIKKNTYSMDGPKHHHLSIYVILADVTQPFYTADS